MKKVLVVVESSYGKNDGIGEINQYTAVDSKELRQEILEEWFDDDIYDDVDGFINGQKNSIYSSVEGDWDDPTGRHVYITSKEDAMKVEKEKYDKNIKKIEQLFQEEPK